MNIKDYEELQLYIPRAYQRFTQQDGIDKGVNRLIEEYKPNASGANLEDILIMYEIAKIVCEGSLLNSQRCVNIQNVLSEFEMHKQEFLELVGELEYNRRVIEYKEIDDKIAHALSLEDINSVRRKEIRKQRNIFVKQVMEYMGFKST